MMKDKHLNDLYFVNEKIITVGKKKYVLNDKPFGVLTCDENSPLFSVSVSNSSLSIDIWSGCAFGCKYCHVQGIYNYIKDEGKMRRKPVLNTKYSINEIIDCLINHPFFEKNTTIISIGTGSTEPFGNDVVTKSTIDIMLSFVERGLKNPFWIVTKAGIPDNIIDDIKHITKNGNKIMLSICWADNPIEIEPSKNNRFKNIELFKDIDGVFVAWYLRPLVKEWSANKENLVKMFEYVSENYKKYIDMIVPGGLRWTSGIEYALVEINKVKLPELIKNDNKKTLDDEIINTIKKLSKQYFPNIPLFFNSSCPLSYMIKRNNISLSNFFKNKNCQCSICPKPQRRICNQYNLNRSDLTNIESKLNKMGINIKIELIDLKNKKIITNPSIESFNYSVKQIIIRTIASY